MSSPATCPRCSAHPERPCVERGSDGVDRPLEGGLIHVERLLAAVNAPDRLASVEALPPFARHLECPRCGERRRHVPVRVDGPSRWWACECGHERILDTVAVAVVPGGAPC